GARQVARLAGAAGRPATAGAAGRPATAGAAGRCAGAGRGERAGDHVTAGDDRWVAVERVRRIELLDLLAAGTGAEQRRPVDLLGHVAAQVPGHGLEPRQAVDRAPALDAVVAVLQAQDRVLEAGPPALMVAQPGVDPVGVRVEDLPRRRGEQVPLLLGHPAPTERAQEGVSLDLLRAEHLGEPSTGDMPPEVHLPEPFLRVHVTLGTVQVVGGVRIHLRDAVAVTVHSRGRAEPRQPGDATVLRERSSHGPDRGAGQHHGERDQRHQRPGKDAAPPLPHVSLAHIADSRCPGLVGGSAWSVLVAPYAGYDLAGAWNGYPAADYLAI